MKIKRPAVIALTVQLIVLFALPGLTWFVGSLDSYFIMAMLLLLVIHPLCCLGIGIFAGLDVKARWWLVLTSAALARPGDLVFFSFETAFFLYGGINLLLGVLGMAGAMLIQRMRQRNS